MNEMKNFRVEEKLELGPPVAPARATLEFSLKDFLHQLWRNRRMLAGVILLLTGLAAVVTFQMTPRYKGKALIMIAPPKAKVVGLESLLSGTPFNQNTLNSQIAIIESRRFARKVIEKLRLDRDPEFNPALEGSGGVFSSIRSLFSSSSPKLSTKDRKTRELAETVDRFLKVLTVTPVYQSRVLTVTVSSADAKKSALIANAVAEHYLIDQLEAKFDATQRATKWLSGRITALRTAVERSERAVELYRRENGLVKGKDNTTIATTQIAQVSAQLVLARAKRAEVAARLNQIEKLLKSKRGVESAVEVLSSALIQRLRERESEVIGKMAELSAVFGRKHPKMLAVRAEMNDLRRKIRLEVRKIVQQVRNEAEVAQARETSLSKSLAKLEGQVSQLNEKSIGLRSLEREANANRALLETVLARFKETTAQQSFQTPDARIISSAVVPTNPYMPKIFLFIGVAFIGATVIGIITVILVEHLDSGFRSSEQVEAVTGFPVLGLIPEIEESFSKRGEFSDYLDANQLSPFVESVRGIRLSISMSNVDRPPKIIMITSAAPEEGKSVLAFSLAQIIANSPARAILVDCDLRRPVINQYIQEEREPGLTDYMAGKASLEEVIRKKMGSQLHTITAGAPVPNPSDILSSSQMKKLLHGLAESYEFVIVDCPPVLAVNDARALAPLVDTAVFATRWGKIHRETASYAISQLAKSGVRIAGVALTRVELKRHAEYDYADSGQYHRKYANYYTT